MNNSVNNSDYLLFTHTLDEMLGSIVERVLVSGKWHHFYTFITGINDFLLKSDDPDFIHHYLNIFYPIFFDKIKSSPDKFKIWRQFPETWKIKISNLKDTSNQFVSPSLNNYLYWVSERITSTTDPEYDFAFDEISRGLISEVDPIIWAAIIILVFSPYEPDNKLQSIIEQKWRIGHIGRVPVFSGNGKDEQEKNKSDEEMRTTELAHFIFEEFSDIEYLKKNIGELKLLKYQDNIFENHRLRLLRIFENSLTYLKDNKYPDDIFEI